MMNIVQQDSLVWQYFTQEMSFVKCNFCNKSYELATYRDMSLLIYRLKTHIEEIHPQIIREIKQQIKLTWLWQYFAFNINYDSIRCIFCKDDIRVLKGINYLQDHLLCHNIHEDTKNYLKVGDVTIQKLNLSEESDEKIQKIRDEITSAGLSLYFIYDTLRYGRTMMKCTMCNLVVNILFEKQTLKEHLFNCHNIIVESNASTSTGDQHIHKIKEENQGELKW